MERKKQSATAEITLVVASMVLVVNIGDNLQVRLI